MRGPTEAPVVSLDSFGESNLIIATENAEISLASEDAPVLHTKNDARVTGIVSVTPDISLVFTERNNGKASAAAYQSPDLQQIAGLTLHEVLGGCVVDRRQQTVAVYTQAAVRILKFDILGNPKAKSLKKFELKDVHSCCSSAPSSHTLLIATESEYQLLNIANGSVSPLFPILNGLAPLMVRLGDDFLVVQGTSSEEPAMGLFVDTKGEVARQGNVVQWDRYPTSVAACANNLFSVASGELKIHSIGESKSAGTGAAVSSSITEEPLPPYLAGSKVKNVFQLSYALKIHSNELLSRLGEERVSFVESKVAFLLDDESIEVWKPVPKLVTLENQILKNELNKIEPRFVSSSREQGSAELKYLKSCLILHLLNHERVPEALRELQNGTHIDDSLILYIYGFEAQRPANLFPGLSKIVDSLREKGKEGKLSNAFLISGLKSAAKNLRRLSEHDVNKRSSLKEIEILLAKQTYEDPKLRRNFVRFLLEKDLTARTEILDWLHEIKAYEELENYYSLANRTSALTKLRMSILRDPKSTVSSAQGAAKHLVHEVMRNDSYGANEDDLDMWDIALEIITNTRVDTNIGLELIKSPQFEAKYTAVDVLQALKDHTDAGEPWRAYLKYLVYSKGMFKDDLVTLVVTDIISLGHETKEFDAIRKSYEVFAELDWPKPSYQVWLPVYANETSERSQTAANMDTAGASSDNGAGTTAAQTVSKYPEDLLSHQLELWGLMESELDWVQLMSTFESHLQYFQTERATIYKKLGLHEQSLALLSEIRDFRSVIDYAKEYEGETCSDITYLALRILLQHYNSNVASGYEKGEIIREFLNLSADHLEMRAVMRAMDSSTPFHVIADFTTLKVEESKRQERRAHLLYIAAKATDASLSKS